jgi:hypothetical protein
MLQLTTSRVARSPVLRSIKPSKVVASGSQLHSTSFEKSESLASYLAESLKLFATVSAKEQKLELRFIL